MTAPIITFFNNKGGVGKTSLVYHLAWMYAGLGLKVVAADLDPQANLTAAFLDEQRCEELYDDHGKTIYGAFQPLIKGVGDIADPYLEPIDTNLALLVGDLFLSKLEDELSSQWPACLDQKERAFRVISGFWRILERAAAIASADLVLVDLGPNLGSINRAALIASDFVVVPLAPDLFSLQGLQNLGLFLKQWRDQWQERLVKNQTPALRLPKGAMQPIGYVVLQHSVRLDRPVKAYDYWMARIPGEYHGFVLDQYVEKDIPIKEDEDCLLLLKHYRSLMPMAQEARKPIFALKPADGAIGAHLRAVQDAYQDFKLLAEKIAHRVGIDLP
jgi:chromosome partitioning protein